MSSGSRLPSGPRVFLLGSAVLSAVCAAIEITCKFVFHMHYPFNFPILNPGSITADLLAVAPHFQHLHHIEFFDVANNNLFTYPAPVAIPYAFFLLLPGSARIYFYLFCALVVGLAAAGLGRSMIRRDLRRAAVAGFLTGCFLLSYPFWFELKQGNIEIVVFALCALGVWAFFHDRGWSAAACFGIAGSMKFFPYILLGLFLSRRQYLKAAWAAAVAVLSTLISLWIVYPSVVFTWKTLNAGIAGFRFFYIQHFLDELGFDHSLWALIRFFLPRTLTPAQLGHGVDLYLFAGIAAGITIYFLRIRRLPVINQVLCLVIASILLTPVSFDYTLIHLYTPWALLVLLAIDGARAGVRVPGLTASFVCLALLCSPISEFIYHGVTVEGQIKAVLLVILFCVGLVYPFVDPLPVPANRDSAPAAP